MRIPTEPIGSIPRPLDLIDAGRGLAEGAITPQEYARVRDRAVKETIEELEATGSSVITDGEQAKPSFATHPLHGLSNLLPDGVVISSADGHTRRLPRLALGPFRYGVHAGGYLEAAADVRGCLDQGAHSVQTISPRAARR
jgi:5-methyltetrahydropteroyltriglutamate--homocysteine methyltransferase